MPSKETLQKVVELQCTLKVEKGQYNKFGGYSYRSKEDILEAAKPMCASLGLLLTCTDEVVRVSDEWVYVKSTATLVDVETGDSLSADGWAREPKDRKGMDASQITGSAASYAGKRALGNLLSIDDTKDSDGYEPAKAAPPASGPFVAACTACGMQYQFESREHMAACQCQCGNRSFQAV